MNTIVKLDETHFNLIAEKARAVGKTPEQYLHALIDADERSFDEILAPARRGFESMTDEEIDGLFDRAKKAARESNSSTK